MSASITYEDRRTPPLSHNNGTGKTQLSQPPSPTQELKLWLHQERIGWEEAERRNDSGMNTAWPLTGRCGFAPRCSPQGTHSFRSLGNWASTGLEALQSNRGWAVSPWLPPLITGLSAILRSAFQYLGSKLDSEIWSGLPLARLSWPWLSMRTKESQHLPYATWYAVGLSSNVRSSQMLFDEGRCTPISDVKGSKWPKYEAERMNPCLYHYCQQRANLIFTGSLFWKVAEQGS